MLILTIEEEKAAKLQKVQVQSGLGAALVLNLVLVVLPMLRHCLGELAKPRLLVRSIKDRNLLPLKDKEATHDQDEE